MELRIGNAIFKIIKGDITEQKCDAIVNAANPRLTPGGGVSGAIHRKAGPELWQEAKKLGGCRTGEAKITGGYRLARYVIHTVGPVYHGRGDEAELLSNCYRNSLALALQHKVKCIAFPAISTGIYGYPLKEAAQVAISTIIEWLKEHEPDMEVRLVLYDEHSYRIHEEVFNSLQEKLM